MSIRVGIVEDNDSIRESLAEILNNSGGIRCCAAVPSTEEALRRFHSEGLDVVLMDIHLPGQSGIECVRELKALNPNLQVIMLTIESDRAKVFESLEAGATGYLVKNVPANEIVSAVQDVHRGGSPMTSPIARLVVQRFHDSSSKHGAATGLTRREAEVLEFAAKGYRSKEIADKLSISTETVQTHFRNIYEKLQVRSRAEAVAKFLRR